MKTISLLLFFSLFGTVAVAQEKVYKQIRDYEISSNIDSLQKIVEQRKSKKQNYLHQLITLEWSRYFNSDDFGKDVETIQLTALKQKDSLGLALYYYFEALKNYRYNFKLTFENGLKAYSYFERQKDTLGMVYANGPIMLTANNPQAKSGDIKKSVSELLERNMKFYNTTKDVKTKLLIINVLLNFGHYIDKSPKEQIVYLNVALQILKKNPQFNYLKYSILYGAGSFFSELKDGKKEDNYRKAQWCYLNSYKCLPPKSYYRIVYALMSLGLCYTYTNEYMKAEYYLKKAVDILNQKKYYSPSTALFLYSYYASVQFQLKNYKNAYIYLQKKNEVQIQVDSTVELKEYQELQTKFEVQKKELLIKNLEIEKQASNNRTRIVLVILNVTVLIILIVSYLAIKIRSANKELKKLTQSRDKLFTIISHDLRSPLSSYQRYSEIVGYLVNTKQYARLKEVLKKIDVVGLNLASLLNNLLEWSIIQQKQIHLKPTQIQTTTFFSNILPIYRDMALLKHLNIKEEIQDTTIKTDIHVLSLITRNLLDNAIKYTDEGKEIFIKAGLQANAFVLTISNQGVSMTESQIEKIDRLFNKGYSFDFGEEGIGTGLILIKEFAKTNDIKIVFDHTADNLTTFHVIVENSI